MRPLASAPTVVRSAFRSGGFRGALIRHSKHSPSGVVLVCAFGNVDQAGRFASRWAARLGLSCAVRELPRPGKDLVWGVSLPIAGCVPFDSKYRWAWAIRGLRSVAGVARSVSVALL